MGDDRDRPFSRPFKTLEGLKDRLPRSRKPQAPAAEPSPASAEPSEDERETPPAEVDFGAAMETLGVHRLPGGSPPREPVRRRGADPRSGSKAVRAGRARTGRRGPEDGFDASTPRLDLHGMSAEHALAEVRRRVAEWRAAGVVRARIVTGRGAHSGDGRSAIREAVESWLGTAPGVVGVYRGNRAAGGEGVVLLELRGPGRKGPSSRG